MCGHEDTNDKIKNLLQPLSKEEFLYETMVQSLLSNSRVEIAQETAKGRMRDCSTRANRESSPAQKTDQTEGSLRELHPISRSNLKKLLQGLEKLVKDEKNHRDVALLIIGIWLPVYFEQPIAEIKQDADVNYELLPPLLKALYDAVSPTSESSLLEELSSPSLLKSFDRLKEECGVSTSLDDLQWFRGTVVPIPLPPLLSPDHKKAEDSKTIHEIPKDLLPE